MGDFEKPKTAPCWWCGNPDTRVGYGMQPVSRQQPPGARVECWGSPDEVCGTCSPYVWRNGRDISEAIAEAVKWHNDGPRCKTEVDRG